MSTHVLINKVFSFFFNVRVSKQKWLKLDCKVCGCTVEIKHIPGHQRRPPWEKMLFIFWLCCLWRYCSLKRQPSGGAALTGGSRGGARGLGWCRRGAAAWQPLWWCALLIIIQGKQRLHKNEKCKMMMICFATRHSKTTWTGLSEPWGRGEFSFSQILQISYVACPWSASCWTVQSEKTGFFWETSYKYGGWPGDCSVLTDVAKNQKQTFQMKDQASVNPIQIRTMGRLFPSH